MKATIIYYGKPLPIPPDPKDIAMSIYVAIALPLMGVIWLACMIALTPLLALLVITLTIQYCRGEKRC